jgi:hypothetical protein
VERYINFGGDQQVISFDIYPDAIRVELMSGDSYLYSENGVGKKNIQVMKKLAMAGGELGRYIETNLFEQYDMKVHCF